MFARSSTFHGKPAHVDAGIRFVTDEAGPELDRTEGCRGLSFLVDRESGLCIATSSWDDADVMHAADSRLRAMRERGRDVLGSTMDVDEWEIAVMHRTDHAACCRVSWLSGDVDALAETFRTTLLPELEETPGFCSASLLVQRAGGLGCATTAWESRATMEDSRASADAMRARAAGAAGGQVAAVHEFDLAYAHLHVPELV